MSIKISLLVLLLNTIVFADSFAQKIPLVYDVENTGVNYPKPILPNLSELPIIEPLTDPFEWSDKSGRDTSFASWSKRRSEIKAEIENYEVGIKPARPDTITASYSKGVLTVNVTVNGKTIILTSQIKLPPGTGPFPAVIGMNSGTGSIPSDIFTNNNVATIAYAHDQVSMYGNKATSNPYYKLYPELYENSGQYSAWAWGISRIIDGLELVQDSLPIDVKHLAVTGCSYAGKMALFAGALDERIALTIPQESGGGGVATWRVSQTLGSVETLGATNYSWFRKTMSQFGNSNVSKLPHDHHELCAMIAPRALFVIGNPDMVWLAEESGYVSSRTAHKVWETFGVGDRMGFSFVAGHDHCALPASQKPEVEAFVKKFLLGDSTVNTNITTNLFGGVDYNRWSNWWGSGNPVFPKRDNAKDESVWLEAECATVGSNWDIKKTTITSNNAYLTIKTGLNSTSTAPADSASHIYIPFTVTKDSTYYIFANVICNTLNDDSYWVKLDDGEFVNYSGLITAGLHWLKLFSTDLKAGNHKLTIAYSEDGANLDKLCVSTNKYAPTGKGETAINLCVPQYTPTTKPTTGISNLSSSNMLGQNYPNPFTGNTNIEFEILRDSYVSLKVYSLIGLEVAELAGKNFNSGKHLLQFNTQNLPNGIYYYKIQTDYYSANRKMILQSK